MNANEAAAWLDSLSEEPDWQLEFEARIADQLDSIPIELRRDDAFDRLLHQYRTYHFTWLEGGKRRPLDSAKAVIALAEMGIMPPRSRRQDIPCGGPLFEAQYDDHCWMIVAARAWTIVAIESKVIFLHSFGEDTQIDVSNVNWNKEGGYVDRAVALIKAAYPSIN